MHKLLKAGGIIRIKNGRRYDKAANYGFRKRFNGILKMNNNVNSNIAEKLMAHKKGLDGAYLKPTIEQCFTEFAKAITDLTIDDSERKNLKIEKLEKEKSEHEKDRIEVEDLRKRLEELEYGAKARHGTYAENMLKFRQEKNRKREVLAMLFNYWFEAKATEEEKRQTLKRIKQATEGGEKFDLAWFDGIQKAWAA